jgi:adenylyltransferase/sulfurtransferase
MIPTALSQYADAQDEIPIDGSSVGEVLHQLGEKFPQLKPHLFANDGSLRNFVNVFLNDDNIRDLNQLDSKVNVGDEISLVPAVAGGAVDAPPNVELTNEEIKRYSRHLILPEVGMEGQKKLKASSVLLVGAGGLGSPLGMYLAAAGVGRIGLVDFDIVDHTNLQRQIIHGTSDVGRPKLQSAVETINDINPNVVMEGYEEPLTSQNAMNIVANYDIVIDGTDNFPTRYLVNDACVLLGKPNVYGSIFRFEGQASLFNYLGGPCYRCLYPEPPDPGLVPSCAEGGVLGVLPGIIGLIQATEGLKLMLGKGKTLSGRLLLFDAMKMKFREMKIQRNPKCPICGDTPAIRELIDYEQFCGVPAANVASQPSAAPEPQTPWDISARDFKRLMDDGADYYLLDVRKPHEYDICNLGGTLIPLDQLPARMGELDKNADIIVHCKMGGRSANAVHALREAGFEKVRNLHGGITAWSDEVDPSVPKY